MIVKVTGRNIDISDAVRDQVEKKLSKLDKMFKRETEAYVTFSTQKKDYIVEITIPIKSGSYLRAEAQTSDMYKSIDEASDKIIRQMRRHKTKLEKRFHSSDSIRFDQLETGEVEQESTAKIVKSKRFDVKPMSPEEAVLQMEMLHHNFYVFLNSDTNEFNVVYMRNDGDFGHIEPNYS